MRAIAISCFVFLCLSLTACRVDPPSSVDDDAPPHCDGWTPCPAQMICDASQELCIDDCRHQSDDFCELPLGCDPYSGRCSSIDDCRSSMIHCPSDSYCDDYTGQCVAGVGDCRDEGVACGGDQFCNPLDGLCMGLPSDCRLPAVDCPDDFACDMLSGACSAVPDDCRGEHTSCPPGTRCNDANGDCETGLVDCRVDGCQFGMTCNTTSGACEFPAGDCRGEGCIVGRCDLTTGECIFEADCRLGQIDCDQGTEVCNILTGACDPVEGDSCVSDPSICEEGQACNELIGACVPEDCRIPGVRCALNTTCDAESGQCTALGPPDCRSNNVCVTEEYCNPYSGLCELEPDCRLVPEVCDAMTEECDLVSGACVAI